MTVERRKYLVIVGDGMGDEPQEELAGKTPLEAASMGVELGPHDVAFRCNLVTVRTDETGRLLLADYSAGHIPSEESRALIDSLRQGLETESFQFHPGVSYRHLLVWRNGADDLRITPPHDVMGEPIAPHWQVYDQAPELRRLVTKARPLLADHEVNRKRLAQGKPSANAIWLWGQGRKPTMPTLRERFGLTGVAISAVDLIRGLGVSAGLEAVVVPGATGYLDTNYAGKVTDALRALGEKDLAFVHVEAPDEASHEGKLLLKIEAIEAFDARVVGPLLDGCGVLGNVRVLLITDHLTPIRIRTHARGLVPFAVCDVPGRQESEQRGFSERDAAATGFIVRPGHGLMEKFIRGNLH
ncbi:MAG TPA: 2,3-bisphosphoglycerate-independent phosphoglycerate mutase [Syntrophobacteria bacterium]|nr:2,3-bisphosphoglycerate-independent phosphoglycerate mutase [Syntrophobacteria bacterium]